MHARRTARDAFLSSREDDAFFSARRGDIVLRRHTLARELADRLNRRPGARTHIQASELTAMTLLHELLHAVIERYRLRFPDSFARLVSAIEETMGEAAKAVVVDFVAAFPPPVVYRALRSELPAEESIENTPPRWVERSSEQLKSELDEELLLLWVTSQNKAYEPIADVVGDAALGPRYRAYIGVARKFFESEPAFGPNGETLLELLLEPGARGSIFDQVEYVDEAWSDALGIGDHPAWSTRAGVEDLRKEEGKWIDRGGRGPGPGEPLLEAMKFHRRPEDEPAQFSPDLNWMPHVVLIAKSVYVWLDQLGKKYERSITRLDQIPDEELDAIRESGVTGLWLIGLFERSNASRRVKQMRGDSNALASAYSLYGYNVAHELGGVPAWQNLRDRAWQRGLRLAADMVPNHVGIDGEWVMNHPDWFMQAPRSPYPNYRFGGPDLSSDSRAAVQIEDGYWNMTDAAVVFRRTDRHTGEERFIYHGNDGTSMPWNDTAQLDYSKAFVRHAVIETILHVASMFPIIRFDAAMTLAKRHVQRLWFPLPGQGGEAIPSRSEYAMTDEEFDKMIPVEFWREVVDTVAQRAPDTLLLAEAFWMMEGYFVRTLGMHRVYNSAFMNMLKREENAKYRETITNVLDFDPQILKRFVNFMNNPDEETAISQFGDGDKYFGVCAMMATLPGLPMIGHGQIEGFREKYGMEYARAKFDEIPRGDMIRRHKAEIFPILHRRWMFSGVDNFAIYNFDIGGHIDTDVFAYSNGGGNERALFLFNNREKTTIGKISQSTHRGTLATELLVNPSNGDWVIMRDLPHGLEYLRAASEIVQDGMTWQLGPYQYHLLTSFRSVETSLELPYDRLALELNGAGVPDIDFAARELYLRPLHAPLREACGKGHIGYLSAQLEAADTTAARASIEEKLGHFADGLEWMLTRRSGRDVTLERAATLKHAGERFDRLAKFARAKQAPASSTADVSGVVSTSERAATVLHVDMLLASLHLEGAIELLAQADRSVAIAMYLPLPPELASRPDPSRPRVTPKDAKSGDALASSQTLLINAPQSSKAAVPAASEDEALEAPPPSHSEAETLPELPLYDSDPSLAATAPITGETPIVKAPTLTKSSFQEKPADSTPLIDPVADTLRDPKKAAPHVTEATILTGADKVVDSATGVDTLRDPKPVATVLAGANEPVDPPPAAPAEPPAVEEPKPASQPKTSEKPSSPAALQAPVPPSSTTREALMNEWQLAAPIIAGFAPMLGEEEARRHAAIVILGATLPPAPLAAALRLALGTRRGRQFMNVHEADGIFWLNQERFEELAHFIGEREGAWGSIAASDASTAITEVIELAKREGYKAQEIALGLEKLAPPVPTT